MSKLRPAHPILTREVTHSPGVTLQAEPFASRAGPLPRMVRRRALLRDSHQRSKRRRIGEDHAALMICSIGIHTTVDIVDIDHFGQPLRGERVGSHRRRLHLHVRGRRVAIRRPGATTTAAPRGQASRVAPRSPYRCHARRRVAGGGRGFRQGHRQRRMLIRR
jgi:hypothetical protein